MKLLSVQHYQHNISREEINELPLDHYKGEIQIVTDKYQLKEIFLDIEKHRIVGIDTESKPAFKKGVYNHVALLQIAIPEKVYLIRLKKTGFTSEIINFLENTNITKIGVGLLEDIRDLQKLGPFSATNFIQLNELVKIIPIESNGLRKLTAIILGFRISKNAQVSNWEAATLSNKQLLYAATDAWVCLEMYHKLYNAKLI